MAFEREDTFLGRCAKEWTNLDYFKKMEWEDKGKNQGKPGYVLFLKECQKREKTKDKKLTQGGYDENKMCSECQAKKMVKFGLKMYVCDMCGEVILN